MDHYLDWLLAAHCSPTLAGIKPACLVSCSHAAAPQLPDTVRAYQELLAPRDIRFDLMCSCSDLYLLLVYRHDLLAKRLMESAVQEALLSFGYSTNQPLETMLLQLKQRILSSDTFPHEIGLFLGYPVEDVMGFINYHGQNCKLSGYWKVYGDAEAASKLFRRFSRVRNAVKKRLERGETLLEVFAVA